MFMGVIGGVCSLEPTDVPMQSQLLGLKTSGDLKADIPQEKKHIYFSFVSIGSKERRNFVYRFCICRSLHWQ